MRTTQRCRAQQGQAPAVQEGQRLSRRSRRPVSHRQGNAGSRRRLRVSRSPRAASASSASCGSSASTPPAASAACATASSSTAWTRPTWGSTASRCRKWRFTIRPGSTPSSRGSKRRWPPSIVIGCRSLPRRRLARGEHDSAAPVVDLPTSPAPARLTCLDSATSHGTRRIPRRARRIVKRPPSSAFAAAADADALEAARVEFLGAKSGRLKAVQKQLGSRARPRQAGRRQALQRSQDGRRGRASPPRKSAIAGGTAARTRRAPFDPTLPGARPRLGPSAPADADDRRAQGHHGPARLHAWPTGPRSKTSGTTSRRSTFRPRIRPAIRSRISIWPRPRASATRRAAAAAQPDQHRANPRDGKARRRRCGSSRWAASIGPTRPTPRTIRCSTRSKACWSIGT